MLSACEGFECAFWEYVSWQHHTLRTEGTMKIFGNSATGSSGGSFAQEHAPMPPSPPVPERLAAAFAGLKDVEAFEYKGNKGEQGDFWLVKLKDPILQLSRVKSLDEGMNPMIAAFGGKLAIGVFLR